MPKKPTTAKPAFIARRGQPFFLFAATVLALAAASLPVSVPTYAAWNHDRRINDPQYLASHGKWDILDLPLEFRLNTIHAAMLPTGKVLLVAGSGNNRDNFNAYHDDGQIKVLKTAVLDPKTLKVDMVNTPSDLFCSGHAMLQSGSLLIAGGTSGYEELEGQVTKPAGTMILHNEDPDSQPRTLKQGTKFTSPNGHVYVSTQAVTIQPATKMDHGGGNVMIMHSTAKVFVQAVAEDKSYITSKNEHYTIEGLSGKDVNNTYGQGGPMTLDKQDYRGDDTSYEFDPWKEQYVRTGDLNESRWYPSLPVLTNGDVLAVSGLDESGKITETTERYNPVTKTWSWGPNQAFPTYPALFRTQDPDVLFYSGSSAGYGPQDKGRDPGFWNVKTDAFQKVSGLRDANITETSASVVLPPKAGSNDGGQSSRVMIAGGGGIGESKLVTDRTDIIDLAQAKPRYTPGPNLPTALRYVNMTVTPWDEVFAAGGSSDYRAKHNSYSYQASSINPTTGQTTPLAAELVGRSYHSGSLLLPDGRILVFGNDPLYADKDDTTPGTFEQRIEVFTPPQLYKSRRPNLGTAVGATSNGTGLSVQRGQQLHFNTPDAAVIKTARLIPPSTTTHVTNIEQRSIGAVVKAQPGGVSIDLPKDENLLPDGWYMLFVTNGNGTPSVARMIQVIH